MKAIACITLSFDILSSNIELDLKIAKFLKRWMMFVIDKSGYYSYVVNEVYEKIIKFYAEYSNLKFVQFNLEKTHKLYFK